MTRVLALGAVGVSALIGGVLAIRRSRRSRDLAEADRQSLDELDESIVVTEEVVVITESEPFPDPYGHAGESPTPAELDPRASPDRGGMGRR